MCAGVHVWLNGSTERRALPAPSYQRGPAMLPSHSASRSVNGEQESRESPVAHPHVHTSARTACTKKKKEAHVHTNGYKYTSEMGLQRAQAQSTCSFSAFAQRSIAFKVNPLFVLPRLMCFCGSGYCHIRLFHWLTSRPVSQITELWELKKIGQDKEQTQTS